MTLFRLPGGRSALSGSLIGGSDWRSTLSARRVVFETLEPVNTLFEISNFFAISRVSLISSALSGAASSAVGGLYGPPSGLSTRETRLSTFSHVGISCRGSGPSARPYIARPDRPCHFGSCRHDALAREGVGCARATISRHPERRAPARRRAARGLRWCRLCALQVLLPKAPQDWEWDESPSGSARGRKTGEEWRPRPTFAALAGHQLGQARY